MEGQLLLPERAESVFYHHLKEMFLLTQKDRSDPTIVIPDHLMRIAQKFAKPGRFIVSHPIIHGSKWTARLMMMAINEAVISDSNQRRNMIIIDDIEPDRFRESGERLKRSAEDLSIAITHLNNSLRELKTNTPPKHKPNFRYKNKFTKGRR